MTVSELKSLLSRFNIRPDKRLGQNFLLSDQVLDEIVVAAELNSNDTVLEIGPGLGVLTRRLGERAGLVLAVEKDRQLVAALRKMFKNKKNVKIVNEDALFFDHSVILRYSEGSRDSSASTLQNDKTGNYKVVANIPYYITGKLLQNFLSPSNSSLRAQRSNLEIATSPLGKLEAPREDGILKPSLMVLLLQKEVAERIVARPGDMSLLSVSVQFYADPEIIAIVPKENFYPRPEVDSAIVKIKVLDKPRLDVNERKFFHLVKIGFSNKRKMLKNNLQAGLNHIVIASLDSFPSLRGTPKQSQDNNDEIASPFEYNGFAKTENKAPRNDKKLDYKQLLSSLGLSPLARAQDLSMEEWVALYRVLSS